MIVDLYLLLRLNCNTVCKSEYDLTGYGCKSCYNLYGLFINYLELSLTSSESHSSDKIKILTLYCNVLVTGIKLGRSNFLDYRLCKFNSFCSHGLAVCKSKGHCAVNCRIRNCKCDLAVCINYVKSCSSKVSTCNKIKVLTCDDSGQTSLVTCLGSDFNICRNYCSIGTCIELLARE